MQNRRINLTIEGRYYNIEKCCVIFMKERVRSYE